MSCKSRTTPFYLISLVLLSGIAVNAQDEECHVTVDSLKYDLSSLAGEHTAERSRNMPPTTITETVRFNLCGELSQLDGVNSDDQCHSGTRVCLTQTNTKKDESDRIISVIPIAETVELNPEFRALSAPGKGLNVIYHGSPYPSLPSDEPIPQMFNLTIHCATEASEPVFKSYDGASLNLEWSTPAGCDFKGSDDAPQEDEGGGGSEGGKAPESVGSGMGWFLLVLLLAFLGYFGLGAYYNYATYGATGMDLIPHRDFWREVPYMARDVASHLCGSFRPRHTSSRGGYIAV